MAKSLIHPAVPALIGLDWGSSTLRAYLFAGDGSILHLRSAPLGVLNVPDRNFAAALAQTVGDWRTAHGGLPLIVSGMIGSTIGWREVPYLACPAGLDTLVQGLRDQQRSAHADGLLIVPGLRTAGQGPAGAAPDVMRGEETQIFGALARHPEFARGCRLILPGTHCKWVAIADGRIASFQTYMTGELFAVLRDHSILGRPAQAATIHTGDTAGPRDIAGAAFEHGVRAACSSQTAELAPLLFSVRTRVLMGEVTPADSLDYMSGLLIGNEVRSALAGPPTTASPPMALIGDAAICALYQRALALVGHPGVAVLDAAASSGLWHLAVASGFVAGRSAPVGLTVSHKDPRP
ncbi:MAG: 2-dehydro-3-deoxygalactonokinase [Hyphomicrobiaceae bacterium]